MSYLDWDEIEHEVTAREDAPKAAQLAFELVPDERLSDAWHEKVLARTKLPQLPLEEWSVSDEAESIFPLLREAGSMKGFVVQQGEGFVADDVVRTISLDDKTASQIELDCSMDMPMAFVDEQAICMLASYFSDYALICLREDLFEKWMDRDDFDLSLWGHEPPYPRPLSIADAQSQAARRQNDWDEYLKKGRQT